MTAICGGGASGVKPGYGIKVAVSAGLISEGLGIISPWLLPFGILLDAYLYDTVNNCATDPPAFPSFTDADIQALVAFSVDPTAANATLVKIKQALDRYLWYQWCQCNSGSPSAIGVGPVQPSQTTIIINPSASACYSGVWAGTVHNVVYPPQNTPMDPQLAPPNASTTQITSGGIRYDCVALAPGATSVHELFHVEFQAGSTKFAGPGWTFFTQAGVYINSQGLGCYPAQGLTQDVEISFAVPANAAWVSAQVESINEPSLATARCVATWYCGGNTQTSLSTPCTTDPAVLALLQQIKQMVVLIQRQAVPFGYIPGTAHSGLVGSGHFGVSGLIGCKIAITTLPTQLGQSGQLPIEIFDAGWITWNTTDGYPHSERLEHTAQLSLPSRCSVFTDLAYDLHPGVIATITELTREP